MTASQCLQALFETSWRASWMIVLLILLRPLLRRFIPARLFFGAWLIVAAHLLAPIGIPTTWSPYNLARPAPLVSHIIHAPSLESDLVPRTDVSSGAAANRSGSTELSAELSTFVGDDDALAKGLLATWLGVAAFLFGVRSVRAVSFRRKLRMAVRFDDKRLNQQLASAAQELGLRRTPELIVTPLVEAPAIFGLWRTTLLFPPGITTNFSDAELRLTMLHELGHGRRRDIAANALLQVARILHWFNPPVWLATRAARQDCELACDEFVMRRATSAETRAYGVTLLKVLGVVCGQARSPLVLGILENKRQLKRRIQMIVDYRTSTLGRLMAGVTLLATLALLAATRELRAEASALGNQPAEAITTAAPAGWHKNGSRVVDYAVGLDRTQPHVKPVSAYIKCLQPSVDGFGGMMQSFLAEDYRGKRVRFIAWVKSENVEGSASVWMRIDGKGERDASLQFDNMAGRQVRGTTDWTQHAVVLDVPQEAEGIFMGFFIAGTGHAWFNDAPFEVVGLDVPSTNLNIQQKQRAKTPKNLDFDETVLE